MFSVDRAQRRANPRASGLESGSPPPSRRAKAPLRRDGGCRFSTWRRRSWKALFRFCACLGTMNRRLLPLLLRNEGGEGRAFAAPKRFRPPRWERSFAGAQAKAPPWLRPRRRGEEAVFV